MSRRYRKQKELTYLDLRVAGEVPIFVRNQTRKKMGEALKWCCEKRGLRIYEYTILPDRILMIADVAWGVLPDTVQNFKHFTSKAMIRTLRRGRKDLRWSWVIPVLDEIAGGQRSGELSIWEVETRSRSLYNIDQIDEHALAIHHASVKHGFVEKPEHYLYCSSHPANPLEGWHVAVTDRGI